ncbi:hypothetical protein SLA2020_085920 [Shorea laevis]
MGKQDEDEDRRREAAIASTPSLHPNFKPDGVTQQQLSKFQELHRRRLQIKSKSKIYKNSKDGNGRKRFHSKDIDNIDNVDSQATDRNTEVEDISAPNLESHCKGNNPTIQQENVAVQLAPKKPQKLHWGLDTKERWERKANM